jgi:signal transduction histidine kinase
VPTAGATRADRPLGAHGRYGAAVLSRLPVRLRVTLAFTAVMATLLAAAGLFLYWQLGQKLDGAINDGLRSRVVDLAAQAGTSGLQDRGGDVAQVLDARGRVIDASPGVRSALLSRAEIARALERPLVVDRGDEAVRLMAQPARDEGRRLVAVVGASLAGRDEALDELGRLLLIGGPIALLLTGLAGYGAAAAALRPVEAMRRRAAEISSARPGRRLPVPPSRDEVSRLGGTLNAMLDRLEEAFARERAFVADASHELRTPLAIVKGELELALRDARDVEAFRAAVTAAAEETDRLVQLSEDLLVIARSDQGRLPVRSEPLEAAGLLAAVRERYVRRAGEHGVALTVAAPADLTLSADGLRLEQALGNLVENALRHGGGAVELEALVRDGYAELHVRDDGPGFPPDFLDRAFERFTRGDAARREGGAGLGLAIVQAIAAAHAGRAAAVNRSGGGADAWVALPVDPTRSGTTRTPGSPGPSTPPRSRA